MSVSTAANLLEALIQYQLLPPIQLEQLRRQVASKTLEPRALGQQLVKQGWLTSYQVEQLLQGRGDQLVIDSYVVLDRIGEGRVGEIFKARHRKMDRTVALKIFRKELVADYDILARFYREVRLISQANHPNLVHAYDAGPIGGRHMIVMEHVEGVDLGKTVAQRGPLPVVEACEYIRQAAVGLQFAHERGLVHRDIQPSNLLVVKKSARGRATAPGSSAVVKILDLGLGRLQPRQEGDGKSQLTLLGSGIMATTDYTSPEQTLDFHGADIRADIWSLGCTLFFLVTGSPPFTSRQINETLLKLEEASPPPLPPSRCDVPPGLTAVLQRMLAWRVDRRYQTPAEVAQALAPFCSRGSGLTGSGLAVSGVAGGGLAGGASDGTSVPGLAAITTTPAALPGQNPGNSPAAALGWLAFPRLDRRLLILGLAGFFSLLLLLCGIGLLFLFPGRTTEPETLPAAIAPTEPARSPGWITIGTYREKFQPRPAPGWQYMWNAKGDIGKPEHYVGLRWEGRPVGQHGRFRVDTDAWIPSPDAGRFLEFREDGGRTGRGKEREKGDYHAIVAYTIQDWDGSGEYRIHRSGLTVEHRSLDILIHRNGNPSHYRAQVPRELKGTFVFDTDLGQLKPGDTIYIAIGPPGTHGDVEFKSFDFAIQRKGLPSPLPDIKVLFREGFEDPKSFPGSWKKIEQGNGRVQLSNERSRAGTGSLRFTGHNGSGNKPVYSLLVDPRADAGWLYFAEFWTSANENQGGHGFLEFVDNQGEVIDVVGSRVVRGRSMEKGTISAVAPTGTRQVRLALGIGFPGDAWFDDILVRKISRPR